MDKITASLARELGQKEEYVENVVRLLDEGNTIPFIARYRKEMHGAMDDTALRTLETRLQYLRGLQERRETVLAAIGEQGRLTEVISPSAAPGRAWPKKRVWGLWPSCFSLRGGTAPSPWRRRRTISTRKRASPRRRRPWQAQVTLSPRPSPTTPRCAGACGS